MLFRLLLLALFSGTTLGFAQSIAVLPAKMPTGRETSVPYGWFDFCQRYRGECDVKPGITSQVIEWNAANRREIEGINRWVNAKIEPTTDMDHWGVADRWDYPTDGKGDNEDYQLLKRKLLSEKFSLSALLMAIARNKRGEGHAFLVIRSDVGDFVLDNLTDDIRLWRDADWTFVKRQSATDPNIWLEVTAGR